MRLDKVGWLLIAVGVIASITVELTQRHRSSEIKRLEKTAISLAASVQSELDLLALKALELARVTSILASDLTAIEALLRRARSSSDHVDYILTGREHVQLINTSSPAGAGQRSRGVDELQAVFTGAPVVIAQVRLNRYTGEQNIGVRVPVPVGGDVKYVLTALVRASVFQTTLSRALLRSGTYAGIVDANGATVARIPGGEAWAGRPAPPTALSEMRQRDRGYAEIVDNDSRFAHTAFVTIPGANWKVGVWSPIFVSMNTLWWGFICSVAITMLGALLVSWRLYRPRDRTIASPPAV